MVCLTKLCGLRLTISSLRAAELLNSINVSDDSETSNVSDVDAQMHNADSNPSPYPIVAVQNEDSHEAFLEAREAHKYILAKSFFDTKEYNRCAAVFLPASTTSGGLAAFDKKVKGPAPTTPLKPSGRSKSTTQKSNANPFPNISQKSLFLALYAKYLSGEKRRDEESEMVLGPADGGMTVNRELAGLARGLEGYFASREEQGIEERNQGWLEYLYGLVLLKSKNNDEARSWLIQAVHRAPFHWGAWRELNDLIGDAKEVRLSNRFLLP